MPYKVAAGRTLFASKNYQAKILDMFGSSIVAYWPQNESGGTVSRDIGGRNLNGAYTGVTLRAQGIGDGETAASFDGTTSYNNVYSAGLNAAMSKTEFTIIAWAKFNSAGVWTDGVVRRVVTLSADASNIIAIDKSANNTMRVIQVAGGVNKNVTDTSLGGITNFFCIALTVSKSNDALIMYRNGVQSGAIQTGLGVWSGALAVSTSLLGAGTTAPSNVWSGTIGPVFILNRAATAGEIAAASTL